MMKISGLFYLVFNDKKYNSKFNKVSALMNGLFHRSIEVSLLLCKTLVLRMTESLHTGRLWTRGQSKYQASGLRVTGRLGHFSYKSLKIIIKSKENVKRFTSRNIYIIKTVWYLLQGNENATQLVHFHTRHETRII